MSGPAPVAADAVLSPCGRYRYLLTRYWEPSRPSVGFVMLNPSSADHTVDDPTVRRCIGFARGWGFGGLRVANLFALRATDPTGLFEAVAAGTDPVGPENAAHLQSLADEHTVVLAWGANAAAVDGSSYPSRVAGELAAAGAALLCFGHCRDGAPRHPLYVAVGTTLVPWRAGP